MDPSVDQILTAWLILKEVSFSIYLGWRDGSIAIPLKVGINLCCWYSKPGMCANGFRIRVI